MHLYDLPACLALISSAFVCVVVHATQKGYLIRCYGDTFGYPIQGTPLLCRLSELHVHEREYRVRPPSPPPSPSQPSRSLLASLEAKRCDPPPLRRSNAPSTSVSQPSAASWPARSGCLCTARAHSTHITLEGSWGFLLPLTIFLPLWTIVHRHNVAMLQCFSPTHRQGRNPSKCLQ